MAKFRERRLARALRKEGKSYRQIREVVKVSKSSLSLWLRDVPLTEVQIQGLKKIRQRAVERYRETMRLKRLRRVSGYYKDQAEKLLPVTERELFIAGAFLYLGEGNKVSRGSVGITNTDPSVIKFALYWIINCLKIPVEKIRVQLHLYDDMDIKAETDFWFKELKVPENCLMKPYIKKSTRGEIDQKGFGHGTCGLWVHNTVLKENLMMSIRVITDNYSVNPHKFDIIA